MTLNIKRKLLIGTSLAASISAIASSPAFASSLTRATDIQFFTNDTQHQSTDKPNIATWTFDGSKPAEYDSSGIGNVNRQKLNSITSGNINKAISALTDNSSATNVELFTNGETIVDHVGFNAKLGKNTIKVESVTKADWADGKLANSWLTGFRNTYGSLMSNIPTTPGSNMLQDFNNNYSAIIGHLNTNGFNTAGDPNIGDVTYDETTGKLQVDLVGHLDMAGKYVDTRQTVKDTRRTIKDTRQTITQNNQQIPNPTYNKQIPNPTLNQQITNSNYLIGKSPDIARNSTGNPIFDAMLFNLAKTAASTNTKFQMSEIAKITFNGETDYAFSFLATESSAIAGDRNLTTDTTSHTGIYSWNKTVGVQDVPEPSALVGLMVLGGMVTIKRQQKMKKA